MGRQFSRSHNFANKLVWLPAPQFMVPSLENVFGALRAENHLKQLDPDRFAIRAGYYLGEINAIHPFREGNGRTQREFIRCVALVAGHRLTWKDLSPEENNSASRISYATGNSSALAAMIRKQLL